MGRSAASGRAVTGGPAVPPWESAPLTTPPARAPRVLMALSAFKGTLSAREAVDIAAAAFRAAAPGIEVVSVPVADGGSGTARALVDCLGGAFQPARVLGPLGEPVDAEWAALANNAAAVEMASASGLHLVPPERRDPLRTTSHGTGQLIAEAIDAGAKRVLLGVGDTATVDGGLGACQALGLVLKRADGSVIAEPITGGMLDQIAAIDAGPLRARLGRAPVEVLCDVDNPLLGERGAARVFGPQKGATPEAVEFLEAQLDRAFALVEEAAGKRVRDAKGAGAAGGIGAAAMALWNGVVVGGAERLLALLGVNQWIGESDLVVVGEGRMDAQSLHGKASGRIAQRASARGVPVAALVGAFADDGPMAADFGVAFAAALRPRADDAPSPDDARRDMRAAADRLAREAAKRFGWQSAPTG